MKSNLFLGTAAALAVAGFAALAITGCGQGAAMSSTGIASGTGAATSATTTAMVVTVGDAPLSNILSAKVTVSSITLTPSSGGSAVTVLSTPRTIELSSLGAIQEPLETQDVAAGTYSAVNVTISSANVTYLNSSNQVTNGSATIGSPNSTVTLSPALTITQGQDVHLSLNFNLAQSFDLSGSTLTFTPSITSAAASIEQENSVDREVEVTGSVVSSTATSITVQSSNTGVQSTFTINSSTRLPSGLNPATIPPSTIVTIHGTVQADGSLLATSICTASNGNSPDMSQSGGRGIVTAVTKDSSGNVTSFTFVPREDYSGDTSGNTMTVDLSSSTVYGVSQDAIQNGIAATAFTNAEIFPGQSVEVMGAVSGGTVTAQQVNLAPESLSGKLAATPQGASPSYTFSLQLPAQSFLTTYDSLTTLSAATNTQTQYEDTLTASSFGTLAAGTSLEIHGYLLLDNSNNFSLTVADISQIGSDN
jgi:hypothetical protein